MLSCAALSVLRERRLVLSDVTAMFAPGQITALIGPNGAGKSTLLAALAGLLPAAGDLRLNGVPLHRIDPRARARQIAYLPQHPDILWDMAVRDIVMLGRMPHRSGFSAPSNTDHDAVTAAMQATATIALASRTVHRLSGGERARVMLARCLASTPDWLMIDEPLTHLDPKHQHQILSVLRAQADAGRGIVLVLHDLAAAARTADQLLVLRDGRTIAQGPPEAVMTADCLARAYDTAFDVTRIPRWSITVRDQVMD